MSKGAIYSITSLLAAKNLVKLPILFLWETLIGREKAHRALELEIHTKVGNRTIVPLVGRRENGIFIKREAFGKKTYAPQMLKAYKILDAELIGQQQFGSTMYGDPLKSLAKIMMEDVFELRTVAQRTKQYLLAEVVTTGILPSNTGSEAIDFGGFRKTVLVGPSQWTHPDSDPILTLKEERKEIHKETGILPDVLILSPEIGAVFQDHPKIKEMMKYNQGSQMTMAPKELRAGVGYIGYLPEIATTVYTYSDFVDDLQGNTKDLISNNLALYVKKGSFTCDYAMIIAREKAGQDAKGFVMDELIRKKAKGDDDQVELLSAPFIRPETPGSWAVIEVMEKKVY